MMFPLIFFAGVALCAGACANGPPLGAEKYSALLDKTFQKWVCHHVAALMTLHVALTDPSSHTELIPAQPAVDLNPLSSLWITINYYYLGFH